MTDSSRPPGGGRIDLRSIDEPVDPHQADRVIGAAMLRASARADVLTEALESIANSSRPLLAAAAVLLIAAGGTLLLTRSRAEEQPTSVVATWAEAGHVPTNGELLAAFQGYGR